MQRGHYLTCRGGMLSLKEIMWLQGIPIQRVVTALEKRSNIKETSLLEAIGNAMSVNILERVVPRALSSPGFKRNLVQSEYDRLPSLPNNKRIYGHVAAFIRARELAGAACS